MMVPLSALQLGNPARQAISNLMLQGHPLAPSLPVGPSFPGWPNPIGPAWPVRFGGDPSQIGPSPYRGGFGDGAPFNLLQLRGMRMGY